MASDRRRLNTLDLLILGRAGHTPALLLYGVTVGSAQVSAEGYTVLYAQTARILRALEHTDPEERRWQVQRSGIKVKIPRLPAGHFVQTAITLQRK